MRKDDANEESGTLLFGIWNVKDRSLGDRQTDRSGCCGDRAGCSL